MKTNALHARLAEGRLRESRETRESNESSSEDQRALYADLFEGTSEVHVLTDAAASVIEANAAARAFFGVSTEEIVGKRLAVLLAPGDAWRVRAAIQDLSSFTDGSARVEFHARCRGKEELGVVPFAVRAVTRADGSVFAMHWSARPAPSRGEGDPFTGGRFDRLAADLTRSHEEAERELRARDHFMATLAHELRMPLNAILGYARMLQAGQVPAGEVDRAYRTIERSALAQAKLISDLVEAARIGQGKVEVRRAALDLVQLVDREVFAARPTAEARGIRIVLDVAGEGCLIEGDAPRLAQAVSNLVSNAIKFSPRGGRISVSLRLDEHEAVVRVSDAGEGIAADALPHVFERFWQADEPGGRAKGGLGLGLSIVRDVVEMHGGTVRAESRGPGLGATFTMTLPVDGGVPAPALPGVHRPRERVSAAARAVREDGPPLARCSGTID